MPIMILTDNRHGECIPAVNAKYFTRVFRFGFGYVTTLQSVTIVFFLFRFLIRTVITFTRPSLFVRTSST